MGYGGHKRTKPGTQEFSRRNGPQTVIGRACKLFISSSDDSTLALAERISGKKEYDVEDVDAEELKVQAEIQENANVEKIDIKEEPNGQNKEPGTKSEQEPDTKKKTVNYDELRSDPNEQFIVDF